MQRSDIFYEVMKDLPDNAKSDALNILKSLKEHDTLKNQINPSFEESLATKKMLCESINQFKDKHPELVEKLYSGFSTCSKQIKKINNDKKRFIKNMLQLRILTSNVLIANNFYEKCLKHDSVLFINDSMLKGYVPSDYDEMTDEYIEHIKGLASGITKEFKTNPEFANNIISTFKDTMGWDDEKSKDQAEYLKHVSALIDQEDIKK